ncbi:hypothetical protein LSH36_595g02027 [Paralvinella palmiformis]|uniref:EGF-like domain-containing protein n=1 Tax=Paralvinella palmiformis TaxID=53620 RepID=A0AAD9J5N1_9ANNE|nr:hypothetical protein LSH36_595g02027 [Paralvinella palmiformis]
MPKTTCDLIDCNNGSLDIGECKCFCLEPYHGKNCQYLKNETATGVNIIISGNMSKWPTIKKAIEKIIIKELVRSCNAGGNTCCPKA